MLLRNYRKKIRVLIIAPHPDDEVLGCGGTIARLTKDNDQVYLCLVTKAYRPEWSKEFIKNRPKEIKRVNKILGINKTYFLDFPTVKLDTIPQKDLIKSISKVIKRVKPEIMFIPHKGDLNKDHRLVFEASLVAARPIDCTIEKLLSYETLSESEWGQPIEPFNPNVYVDIAKTYNRKIKAIKVYTSELRRYPHPRSLEIIEALAKKRGSEIGVKLAEAFILIKEFHKR